MKKAIGIVIIVIGVLISGIGMKVKADPEQTVTINGEQIEKYNAFAKKALWIGLIVLAGGVVVLVVPMGKKE